MCQSYKEDNNRRKEAKKTKVAEEPRFHNRIGVFRRKTGYKYEDYSLAIPEGGGIFVYTDGVAEARNPGGDFFGTEAIEKSLNSIGRVSPEEIITRLKEDLDSFAGEAEQFDDITMLCLLRSGGRKNPAKQTTK